MNLSLNAFIWKTLSLHENQCTLTFCNCFAVVVKLRKFMRSDGTKAVLRSWWSMLFWLLFWFVLHLLIWFNVNYDRRLMILVESFQKPYTNHCFYWREEHRKRPVAGNLIPDIKCHHILNGMAILRSSRSFILLHTYVALKTFKT